MNRKQQLLDAGLNIARAGGMSAVSLSEVARRSRCSHGTVSFHFGGLRGLQREVRAAAIKMKDAKVLAWLRAAGEKV